MVTGRVGDFASLKRKGGLSGYPCQAESDHDIVENSHASTSLSYADGIAKAHQLRGLTDRHVVAVIGDGALTGGMAWEALNNIAADKTRRLVIVVNDNERSYAPTIGGLAHHLATLRTTRGYERFLEWGKHLLGRTPVVGGPIYDTLHGMKKGIKDIVAPQGMFEDLGLKYIGPIDGHDIDAVEHALRRARGYNGPVLVHCITHKGQGYQLALDDAADNFHGIGVFDPETGLPVGAPRHRVEGRLREGDGLPSVRSGPTSSASRRPCCCRSGWESSRSGSPSGSSTSASPSSTPRPPRRVWPWGACIPSSRSTRRSSTGPSTRC